MNIVKQTAKILIENRMMLATAESCTGGMIASEIVAASGASEFYKGGVVAYSNDIKQRVLKVPAATLARYGAVSAQTVKAMAEGVTNLYKCDCSVSVSGIAGPAGGTAQKPVGLVFIGVMVKSHVSIFRFIFKGNRTSIRRQASSLALKRLWETLKASSSFS
jgi:PncC family amidohydrolase